MLSLFTVVRVALEAKYKKKRRKKIKFGCQSSDKYFGKPKIEAASKNMLAMTKCAAGGNGGLANTVGQGHGARGTTSTSNCQHILSVCVRVWKGQRGIITALAHKQAKCLRT